MGGPQSVRGGYEGLARGKGEGDGVVVVVCRDAPHARRCRVHATSRAEHIPWLTPSVKKLMASGTETMVMSSSVIMRRSQYQRARPKGWRMRRGGGLGVAGISVVAACMGAQKSFAPAPMPTPPGGAACGGLCLVAASSLRLWQAVSVSVWGLPKM